MRRSLLAVAALCIATAAIGGCTFGGSTSTWECNSPGVTSDQVKIGVIYPDSGTLGTAFSAVRSGIDARIGLANETGGVYGRKLVYEWRDDQSTPEGNSIAARNLVDDKQVFGIVESTVAASGSAPYLAKKGIPVTGIAAEAMWSKYRNMFSFAYTTDGAVDTFGQFVKARGGQSAVVLQTALSGGISAAAVRYVRSMTAVGLDYAGEVPFTSNADDPVAAAQRIVASGADTLLAIVQPPDYVKVLAALRDMRKAPKIVLAVNGYDTRLFSTFGAGMAGVIVPVFYRPFELKGPPITSYESAMARFAPQIQQPDQDLAMMSYIHTDMFIRGLEAAGPCPTRRSFIDRLRAVRSYDAGGLIQPVNFQTGLGKPTTCYSFVQANPAGTAFTVLEQNRCGKEVAP